MSKSYDYDNSDLLKNIVKLEEQGLLLPGEKESMINNIYGTTLVKNPVLKVISAIQANGTQAFWDCTKKLRIHGPKNKTSKQKVITKLKQVKKTQEALEPLAGLPKWGFIDDEIKETYPKTTTNVSELTHEIVPTEPTNSLSSLEIPPCTGQSLIGLDGTILEPLFDQDSTPSLDFCGLDNSL